MHNIDFFTEEDLLCESWEKFEQIKHHLQAGVNVRGERFIIM